MGVIGCPTEGEPVLIEIAGMVREILKHLRANFAMSRAVVIWFLSCRPLAFSNCELRMPSCLALSVISRAKFCSCNGQMFAQGHGDIIGGFDDQGIERIRNAQTVALFEIKLEAGWRAALDETVTVSLSLTRPCCKASNVR